MAIRVKLHHQTTYDYDRAVALGPQAVRLRPAPHTRTPVAGYSLRVEPGEHFINWQQDPQSNWIARVVVPKPSKRFRVTVDLVADLSPINPFDFFLEGYAESFPFKYEAGLERELRPYLEVPAGGEGSLGEGALGEKFRGLVASIDLTPRTTIDFLVMVNQRINQLLGYTLRMEAGIYTPEQTLEKGIGSCRDFAWLLVLVLRELGLAARFVSGYSIQLAADEKPIDGPSGVSTDVVDLHAWAEVFLPGAGWVGLDATSGMMCTEGHIPLACSPEPTAAAPISGGVEPSGVAFGHTMEVVRIHEDPRVTLPYTEGQWEAIDQVARGVDERLAGSDVRLTMGGEPTFISVDDYESAQWNTAAVGKEKLERSVALIRKLRERFGKGGLLHCGQGKWYPGEPLPRWALAIYWRADGEAVWGDEKLLVDTTAAGGKLGHTTEDAFAFINGLAGRLGLDRGFVTPAYEDAEHYEKVVAGLPANVTVSDNKLENKQDGARLARVYEQGLERPTGFVLPVLRPRAGKDGDGPRWKSSVWDLRSNTQAQRRIVCVPGDSPLGLRLPLASLPYTDDPEADKLHPEDPTAKKAALPRQAALMERVVGAGVADKSSTAVDLSKAGTVTPAIDKDDKQLVRLALAVEVRDGVLRVFMPPTEAVEDYLELLAAVEATAAAMGKPVIVEGYEPPYDPRLRNLKVTPDPGVIEVNVQPASDWEELKAITTGLYEDARATRLGTDKYQLDGKHTGTGGGNHVVVGAATPLDSPFLRRPDMLRSVVAYWQNHPSLSYLFSGMFIGPTSQAPRVDEGRVDALYELELAMQQTPNRDAKGEPEPWLVDRLYRNLLTDLTGNTHRAEICIDKLYSPDSSTGRLGLVEFRGFEMPPHPRMSLTQQLLLRSLLLMFWEQPYVERPRRWGTALHDRFLLPHYCVRDLEDVLYDLRTFGIKMERQWFTPHIEFRFPIAGRIVVDEVSIELRSAIEPWYTLGEEPAGGGMTRYVDGSVERLQVLVKGLDIDRGNGYSASGGRLAVAVNGVELPLHPTGSHGEGVCGLRFRAWQPPHCLHPRIPVDTPLVFDVVDRWEGQALGGGTYHAAHPGGRSYDTFPVNALEAEARRKARFFAFGHTPGPIELSTPPRSAESQYTLDLRRVGL